MPTGSNLRFFLITAILFIYTQGCEKDKNDVIPDVYIDFTIDLSDPEFRDLNAAGNFVVVDASTNNFGQRAAGFSGNGIIIYHAMPGEFYAFDRTCPHDYVTEGTVVKVDVDGVYATCPVCGTSYALPSYGNPSEGPGRHRLKNYKTSFNANGLRVWNHI
jgi:nitrite reductase/ring-hydroxylating ferredoxin subunit